VSVWAAWWLSRIVDIGYAAMRGTHLFVGGVLD